MWNVLWHCQVFCPSESFYYNYKKKIINQIFQIYKKAQKIVKYFKKIKLI